MINFFCNSSEKIKDKAKLKIWIKKSIQNENFKVGSINYIFCTDEYLLDVNKKFLNHDYFTDIITFDYTEKPIISGDLFISTERVLENAKQLNLPFENELKRVMIHGIIHLFGYQDKTKKEKETMTEKENLYLHFFDELQTV
jgi:probable rRNA maturation factor